MEIHRQATLFCHDHSRADAYCRLTRRLIDRYGYDREDNELAAGGRLNWQANFALRSDGSFISAVDPDFAGHCAKCDVPADVLNYVSFHTRASTPEESEFLIECELQRLPTKKALLEKKSSWSGLGSEALRVSISYHDFAPRDILSGFYEVLNDYYGLTRNSVARQYGREPVEGESPEHGVKAFEIGTPAFLLPNKPRSWDWSHYYREYGPELDLPRDVFGEFIDAFSQWHQRIEEAFLVICGVRGSVRVDDSISSTTLSPHEEGVEFGPRSAWVYHRDPQDFAHDWLRAYAASLDLSHIFDFPKDFFASLRAVPDVSVKLPFDLPPQLEKQPPSWEQSLAPGANLLAIQWMHGDTIAQQRTMEQVTLEGVVRLGQLSGADIDEILTEYCAAPDHPKYLKLEGGGAALIGPLNRSLMSVYKYLYDEGLQRLA